jgi:hypothetical protein
MPFFRECPFKEDVEESLKVLSRFLFRVRKRSALERLGETGSGRLVDK